MKQLVGRLDRAEVGMKGWDGGGMDRTFRGRVSMSTRRRGNLTVGPQPRCCYPAIVVPPNPAGAQISAHLSNHPAPAALHF